MGTKFNVASLEMKGMDTDGKIFQRYQNKLKSAHMA
jgi:hypothetical protein